MDQSIRIVPSAHTYIDDILIANPTPEQHLTDLQTEFERLSSHSVVINPNKCLFGVFSLEFLKNWKCGRTLLRTHKVNLQNNR